jgi:hypothetical protein
MTVVGGGAGENIVVGMTTALGEACIRIGPPGRKLIVVNKPADSTQPLCSRMHDRPCVLPAQCDLQCVCVRVCMCLPVGQVSSGFTLVWVAAAAVAALADASTQPPTGPTVNTSLGVVVGIATALNTVEFLGLPYAKAPRWSPPVDLRATPLPTQPFLAQAFGPCCPQVSGWPRALPPRPVPFGS